MLRSLSIMALALITSSAFALPELSFQTEQAFPLLTFSQPILLLEAPDNSGRIFVLERAGRIKVFPKSDATTPGEVTTYLDITDRVTTVRDFALNGFDFHPDFVNNGEIYVHYNWKNGTDETDLDYGSARISRFTASNPADNTISAATEEILHQHRKVKLPAVAKPLQDHNGGTIAFGLDGKLYVVFGDGGSDPTKLNTDMEGQDPLGNGQNTENLFGTIIRIDVDAPPDSGLGYHIPTDNPFYVTGPAGTSTRKEIWAYGLRNPWRFAFDDVTGELFAVDVGAKSREEVNLIEAGKNYGWRLFEGTLCVPTPPAPPGCDDTGLTPPIVEHEWSNGEFRSLTGGYVYRGNGATQLRGRYLYGDYVWGGVWAMDWDGTTATSSKIIDTTQLIAGFGLDQSGEVYLLGYTSGQVFRFKADPAIYPTADNDSISATELVPENGTLVATDAGSIASYQIVNAPTKGDISLTVATGAFVYTPYDLPGNTTDSFTFIAIDNDGNESNIATVEITITATNSAPSVSGTLTATLPEAVTTLTLSTTELGASDSDSASADLEFNVTTAPPHGTITRDGSPATQFTLADIVANLVVYTFTGDAQVIAQDSFQVTVEDETGTPTAASTFTINITPEDSTVKGWIFIGE